MSLITTVIAWYHEPLFWLFPFATSAIGMTAFALFATPFTILALRDPPSLRRYRIQARRMPPELVLGPSIRHYFKNNLTAGIGACALWPLLRLSHVHAGPLPSLWEVAWQLVLFIYLDDFLYYWMHRAFHWKWLYKYVHSVHHRIPAPWACGGNYMHSIEFGATSVLVLIGPMLVGAHVLTLWIWIVLRQWEAAEGHSGYAFPWNPSYLIPGYGGTEFHDYHHGTFKGNYAGFTAIWDRVFGTLSPGYVEYHAAHKPGARPAS